MVRLVKRAALSERQWELVLKALNFTAPGTPPSWLQTQALHLDHELQGSHLDEGFTEASSKGGYRPPVPLAEEGGARPLNWSER